jgi:hypothetical protein
MKMTANQKWAQEEMTKAMAQYEHVTDDAERKKIMKTIRHCAKVLGINLEAQRRKFLAELKRKRKVAARKLTREMRQQILDLVHAQKSMEEITAATGVSASEVMGTVNLNIITTRSLRTESI